jgi:predicted nucleic acid-binding protein
MKRAYVDTSYLLSVVLREQGWQRLRAALRPYDALLACDLLCAELLATLRREDIPVESADAWLAGIQLVYPDRTLRPEMDRVLERGYLRGADLWHLACACYVTPAPSMLSFFSRDERQREVARALGFPTP